MLNVVDTLEAVFSRNYRVFIDVSSFLFCITTVIPLWLSSFVCNSFSSLHFFWKYESKLKSTQVYKGEEHNLTLSLREIYPLVLTIELKEFELLEEF